MASALAFVAVYGIDTPFADEWAWFPVVSGQQAVTPAWLWSQHNEHRMPLPRLVYVGLGYATGWNFRAGAYGSVVLLAALAAAMMLTARRLRGRWSLCDAFFPLLLLNWAAAINLIWGFQINFVAATTLTGGLLLAVINCGERLSLPAAALATACMLGAGACGAYGLAYLPPMAGWLVLAAGLDWRRGEHRPTLRALVVLGLAAVAVGYTLLYFRGLTRPAEHPPASSVWATLRAATEFLTGSLGPAAKKLWPVSAWCVLGICLASAWKLATILRCNRRERVRAAGLVSFLAAVALLALGIGYGRACFGPGAGLVDRYGTLTAPLLCLFYLQSALYDAPRRAAWFQGLLAVTMCLLFVVDARKGLQAARQYTTVPHMLVADAHAGMQPDGLALRYAEQARFTSRQQFAEWMGLLRERRWGPWRGVGPTESTVAIRAVQLAEIAYRQRPVDVLRLVAGEQFTQRFVGTHPADVFQIDIQLTEWQPATMPSQLCWKLQRTRSGSTSTVVAEGLIDLCRLQGDDYARLHLPPIAVAPHDEFTLTLSTPAAAAEGKCVRIPLYASSSGPAIKGLIYGRLR